MNRETPKRGGQTQKPLAIGFMVSLVALWVRRARRASKKLKSKATRKPEYCLEDFLTMSPKRGNYWESPLRTPLRGKPKELLTSIGNKAKAIVGGRGRTTVYGGEKTALAAEEEEEEEYGVWQRAILMGDKCQPLDFSGVIYYDCSGRQLKDVPIKSPRGSPLPAYLNPGGYVVSPFNNPTVGKGV